MKIICRVCDKEVEAADIDLSSKMAKCHYCNEVFSISDQIEEPDKTDTHAAQERASKPTVALPEKFELMEDTDYVKIVRRWFTPVFLFLAFFCIAWDGFLLFWYSMPIPDEMWIMKVFPIGHVAVGIGLTYYTLAGFFNKTIIEVYGGALTIIDTPFTLFRNKHVASEDIKQLYVKERRAQSRNSYSTSYYYEVHIVTRDNKNVKLLGGLTDHEQALFIEQKIEGFLGIKDERVAGEMRL